MKKDLTLYERNEKSELIPQQVELEVSDADKETNPELIGQTIKIIPMKRGEIAEIFNSDRIKDAKSDLDKEIVEKFCKDPVYTKEDLEFLKPIFARCIAATVMRESGLMPPKKVGAKVDKEKNDEFGKN